LQNILVLEGAAGCGEVVKRPWKFFLEVVYMGKIRLNSGILRLSLGSSIYNDME
jgi:hypothetical protein